MRRSIFEIYKQEFEEYFKTKLISQTIAKKFISSFYAHIEENQKCFKKFWEFIKENRDKDIKDIIPILNEFIINEKKLSKTFYFVADWSHSYLGPGEIICLLLSET